MSEESCSTGIAGLDRVLGGGFPCGHLYLVAGRPGAGKTTLGLSFLLAGAAIGQRGVYVTLSETKNELMKVGRSHGWSLDAITVIELSAIETNVAPAAQGTVFFSSEVELNETSKALITMIDQVRPARLVLDSMSDVRLLAGDALRYRRQVLFLKQHFTQSGCTTVILDDTVHAEDMGVSTVAHGVLKLEQIKTEFGAERRRLSIEKMRGITYQGGNHDYVIRRGGLQVFPRLVAAEAVGDFPVERLSSSIPNLDALLGGGLDRGTTTLILGPAGAGKSTVANQFALSAAKAGKRVAFFSFEESRRNLLLRAAGLGIDLTPHVDAGTVVIRQIDPAELTPGELAYEIKQAIEQQQVEVVVLDSLNGYLQAMTQEQFLILHLHELLTFLDQNGVVTIMIMAQHGLLGHVQTPVDVSYLADTVVVIRYFEAMGRIKKAISVVKKRIGPHENSIRELSVEDSRLRIGDPIEEFQGVLTGTPSFSGATSKILPSDAAKTRS